MTVTLYHDAAHPSALYVPIAAASSVQSEVGDRSTIDARLAQSSTHGWRVANAWNERDLIVLGAGSGGISAAIRAARYGARVTLLEPNAIGGTCVNVGCVPKKAMWIAAELAEAQAVAREVGFASEPGALDWVEYVRRRQAYIEDIHASYPAASPSSASSSSGEYGRFVDAKTIAAGTRTLAAKHIVIATGAKPRRSTMPGGELGIVSDGFFDLRAAPRRVAIVGGGYIAVELAGVLHALGAQVSRVRARRSSAAPGSMSKSTAQLCDRDGGARRVGRRRARARAVTRECGLHMLHFADGETIDGFDALIWAIGRDANTQWLDLDKAGRTPRSRRPCRNRRMAEHERRWHPCDSAT